MELAYASFLDTIGAGWVGSSVGILGLIGMVVSLFLYVRSRVGPRLSFQYKALRLIGGADRNLPEDVKVFFKEVQVERLTKTHIVLWNSGRATLDGERVVEQEPVRFHFEDDSEVLSARVLHSSRPSSKASVRIMPDRPNVVVCTFDYLESGDGVVLETLHTAKAGKPQVEGTIRGVPKGVLYNGRVRTYRRVFVGSLGVPLYSVIIVSSIFLGAVMAGLAAFAPTWLYWPMEPPATGYSGWVFVAIGVVYVIMGLFMWWTFRRRFPRSLMIDDLE